MTDKCKICDCLITKEQHDYTNGLCGSCDIDGTGATSFKYRVPILEAEVQRLQLIISDDADAYAMLLDENEQLEQEIEGLRAALERERRFWESVGTDGANCTPGFVAAQIEDIGNALKGGKK